MKFNVQINTSNYWSFVFTVVLEIPINRHFEMMSIHEIKKITKQLPALQDQNIKQMNWNSTKSGNLLQPILNIVLN